MSDRVERLCIAISYFLLGSLACLGVITSFHLIFEDRQRNERTKQIETIRELTIENRVYRNAILLADVEKKEYATFVPLGKEADKVTPIPHDLGGINRVGKTYQWHMNSKGEILFRLLPKEEGK